MPDVQGKEDMRHFNSYINTKYELADQYSRSVLARTGLKPDELVCPREKSEMTPCVVRDGSKALACDNHCVGCDERIETLWNKEAEKTSGPENER